MASSLSMSSLSLSDSEICDEWYCDDIVAWCFALITPFMLSVVVTIDKVAVSRHVMTTHSYVVMVGFVELSWGIVFAALTRWGSVTVEAMSFVWPALSGLMLGAATILHVFALEGSDVSMIVGLENTSPLLVTVLSVLILHEQISVFGYVGIAITCVGAVLLTVDLQALLLICQKKCKHCIHSGNAQYEYSTVPSKEETPDVKVSTNSEEIRASISEESDGSQEPIPSTVLPDNTQEKAEPPKEKKPHCFTGVYVYLVIIPLVCTIGLSDFFVKLGTGYLPPMAITAIMYITFGSVVFSFILVPKARKTLLKEIKANWIYPIISETLMVLSSFSMTMAMMSLAAPIVSATQASSPLFVVVWEFVLRLSDDKRSLTSCLAFRLVPVLVVVSGVTLLSLDTLL
ncbi:hypothetical protein Pelo_1229 [Pelomyxa schiedti]|nr:hypothetical protein Pelo_1229 [Pelomyxa schiedti]